MSDSARYSRLLHPKGQGCPLFHPQPFDDLPLTLRQTGTRIGDVGIVTPNGAFDPIFNVCDRAEDNRSGVPQGFEQVRLRHDAIAEQRLCHLPGTDISNITIKKRRLDVDVGFENNVFVPAGAGAVIEVSTNSKETAVLLLPDGASRWDLRTLQVFRNYALKHAPSWYLGRMIGNGDLYFVTGVAKSTSWSVAALENQSGDGQVSLKLKAAQAATVGASCAWEWENATSSVNSGPNRFPGEESWRDNQTVFVRGFKVFLRTKPLRRSPKLLSIVDSKWSDLSSKGTFIPFSHWQPRPEFSSTTDRDFPASPAGISGSDNVSDDEESLNYISNLSHPSDGINEFLLDCTPDAIVAVTHDDDLNSLLTEADHEVPENHELISRILNKFTVETTSDGVYLQARSADIFLSDPSGQRMGLDNVQMDGRLQPSLTSSPCNSTLKDSTVDYPDHDCLNSLEDIPDSIETAYLEQLQQTALGEQNIAVNGLYLPVTKYIRGLISVTQEQNRCILPLTRTRFHSPIKGGITIRPASTQDRVLQYGTVACSLLKDIGNANNQPYLQAIASISLLIMETAQRVKKNKAVTRMTERVYELVCAVINICRDSEADLAPAMIRSIEQFSETLEKILTFVRSQVKGGFWRRVFRSMEVADLITDCNTGLKYALDHFGFQSGIIAPVTMSEIQRDASKRHDELVAILHEKKNRPKRSSPKRPPPQLNTRSAISGIPAPPEIFHGREEEVSRVVNTILHSKSARIAIVGPDGVGRTAIVLVASHDPEVCKLFGQNRFFVDCTPAADGKQLISLIANQLGIALESGPGRKPIIKHLTAISTAETPVLIILDAIGEAWTPYENRNDVEDFLSLLADLEHVTLIVTLCGDERPRQVRWTRPLLHTLSPLTSSAARDTFLDISDVTPDEPGLDELLAITENLPGAITRIAGLAAFEGCMSLIAHWKKNGPARLDEKDFLPSYNRLVEETAVWGASVNSELVSH